VLKLTLKEVSQDILLYLQVFGSFSKLYSVNKQPLTNIFHCLAKAREDMREALKALHANLPSLLSPSVSTLYAIGDLSNTGDLLTPEGTFSWSFWTKDLMLGKQAFPGFFQPLQDQEKRWKKNT
jgi:hypothetical protein